MRDVAQLPTPTIPTRTEPMGLSLSVLGLLAAGRWCWSDRVLGAGAVGGPVGSAGMLVATFGPDEVGEPADLALHGLDAVALELPGVAVDLGLRAGQLVLDPGEALLEPRAAPLQDTQADLHVGGGEEREPDVEVVVLPRSGADLRHQPLELLVARGRDLVDDARPTARRRGGRADLGDEVGA